MLTNVSQRWVELLRKDFADLLTNISQDDQIVSFDDLLSFDELNDQKVVTVKDLCFFSNLFHFKKTRNISSKRPEIFFVSGEEQFLVWCKQGEPQDTCHHHTFAQGGQVDSYLQNLCTVFKVDSLSMLFSVPEFLAVDTLMAQYGEEMPTR